MKAFIALFCFLMLIGCGGGGSSTPPPPPLTVSPTSANVALNGTQSFTASTAASWSVNGIPGGNATVGTIDANGLYKAPANFPSPHTATVSATAGGQSATAAVTIVYPNDNSKSQALPVKMGTSGGNSTDISGNKCCSGTLGALVVRGGIFYIVSANHVLAKSDAGTTGDPVTQPGLIDNNCAAGTLVANLSQKAALKPVSSPGPAPSNVDAAIAQIVPGTVDTSGAILDLGAAGPGAIAAAPPSATLASPAAVFAANEGVAKSGRSTGLTCSNLQSITTNIVVDYAQICGGATSFTATFSNQIVINGGTFTQSGDSGSLLVTSDTARPLGLIYGGNATTSTANPIQDIITAFTNGSGSPTVVGGADHAVSCQPTATVTGAQASNGAASATLTVEQQQRAAEINDRYAASLLRDPAVTAVEIGASADNPKEAALLVTLHGGTVSPIPHQIEGLRTRLIRSDQIEPTMPVLPMADIHSALAVKESSVSAWMSQPGVIGFGVGRSHDNPAETAIAIYVEQSKFAGQIPPEIGGVRTQVFEGERFRAGGWNTTASTACIKPRASAPVVAPKAATCLQPAGSLKTVR